MRTECHGDTRAGRGPTEGPPWTTAAPGSKLRSDLTEGGSLESPSGDDSAAQLAAGPRRNWTRRRITGSQR
ncbi:hypothetical protein NDU88_000988 [Pleurodeles waltl]|uniref:Uncharacterized protein n=1 Tax=Pleurodeles waltl TaxID=8319 RepID=A0AAV7THC9_PLEWA|nr:hypothetical protein NDU88_000988 [Pleurodeles waltl]